MLRAQLCNLLLSRCLPNKEGDATNLFQSESRGILLVECSLYLSSKFVGKFRGIVVVGV